MGIDALTKDLLSDKPEDPLQYCANYFTRQLESERATSRSSQSTTSANGKMTDTAGPFDRNPFAAKNVNSIQEEDEERDNFGSPTDATFKSRDSGRSPFGGSGFGAAGGGGGGGGAAAGGTLFGNWLGTQGAGETGEQPTEPATGKYAAGRRTSVSAESMQPDADSGNWKPPKHSKTPDQFERLKHAVAGNFLFSSLDEESFHLVLDALVEKSIPAANIKVITQGDEGDFFYVIESGDFDIYINPSGSVEAGAEGMGNKVGTIGPGGSFGELALMYNAPRAATIVSASKGGLLWALDRLTFRRILMDNAFQKRKMYEGFLEEVPLLASLKPYERSKTPWRQSSTVPVTRSLRKENLVMPSIFWSLVRLLLSNKVLTIQSRNTTEVISLVNWHYWMTSLALRLWWQRLLSKSLSLEEMDSSVFLDQWRVS